MHYTRTAAAECNASRIREEKGKEGNDTAPYTISDNELLPCLLFASFLSIRIAGDSFNRAFQLFSTVLVTRVH